MYAILSEKIGIFYAPLKLSRLNTLTETMVLRLSFALMAVFLILFLWYIGEVYYTFKLGYAIREKEVMVKNLETEYIKNQAAIIKVKSAESILQSKEAKSMLEVSSLRYLQPKSYFVELRKEIPQ